MFARIDRSTPIFSRLKHMTRDLQPEVFPNKKIYILTDQAASHTFAIQAEIIASLDDLTSEQISNSVFYIYFQCDSDALPHLEKIIDSGGIFIPQQDYHKTHYRFVNRHAWNTLVNTWNNASKISHLNILVHENICEALDITKDLEGDFVEIGVYVGGSAFTAVNYIDELGTACKPRKAWLFDTFDGFNYEDAKNSSDTMWLGTCKLHGVEKTIQRVQDLLKNVKTETKCQELNICANEFPSEITKIAVANLDVDLYEATYQGLLKLAPLIVPGGIIICEDPTSTPGLYGAFLAMEQFLKKVEGKPFMKIFKGGQYFLVKTQ